MKILMFAALIMAHIPAFGQVLLSQGQSQVFEFRAQNPLPPSELFITTFGLQFAPGTFTIGEDATVELFPNTLTDPPFTFGIVSLIDPSDTTSSVGGGMSWSENASPLWPDLQCFIRVTMNAGDSQLEGFSLYVTKASDFSVQYEFASVPEPSVAGILLLGGSGVVVFVRRKGFRKFSNP